MGSGIWSLHLPTPVFWGVLAAWMPIPPAVMAGILMGAMVYALLLYLSNLREWDTEDEVVDDEPLIPLPDPKVQGRPSLDLAHSACAD